MSQDFRSILQLPLKVDLAGYVLKVNGFWLKKPGLGPFGAVSIFLMSRYYRDPVILLSERTVFSFLPVLRVHVKDSAFT